VKVAFTALGAVMVAFTALDAVMVAFTALDAVKVAFTAVTGNQLRGTVLSGLGAGTRAARNVDLRRRVNPSDSYRRMALLSVAEACRNGVPPRARPLRVTQEQPAYFAPVRADLDWPAFSHHLAPAELAVAGYPSGVYGRATPGEGIKAGFHGVGPECDPHRRDFQPEPAQLRALRRYVHECADPDVFTPISCAYSTTVTSDFVLDRTGPVVVAAGFSGHGFKFLPAIGRVLADLALTGDRPDDRFALPRL
jgi:sarcosine oxidase